MPALSEPTGSPEVPDRLAEEADAAEPGSEESPLPVWLAEFGISEIESESSPEQGVDAGEFPDWLRELEAETATISPVEESQPEGSGPAEAGPPASAEATLSTPGVEMQQVEEAIPDWLADLRALEVTETETAAKEAASPLEAAPFLVETPPVEEESTQVPPEWLADLESITEQAHVVETAQFEQAESASAAAGEDEEDIPDWLRQIASEPADETTEWSLSQPTEPPAIEGLAPAEIPEWIVQLKPADMQPERAARA